MAADEDESATASDRESDASDLRWDTVVFRSVVALIIVSAFLCAWAFIAFKFYPCWNSEGTEGRGQFGDMFGGATALFTGLGICAVVWQIWLQRAAIAQVARQIKLQDRTASIDRAHTEAQVELLKKQVESAEQFNRNQLRYGYLSIFWDQYRRLGRATSELHLYILTPAREIAGTLGADAYINFIGLAADLMRGEMENDRFVARLRQVDARETDVRKLAAPLIGKIGSGKANEWRLGIDDPTLNELRREVTHFWSRLGSLDTSIVPAEELLDNFDPGDSAPHLITLAIMYRQSHNNYGQRGFTPVNTGLLALYAMWFARLRHELRTTLIFRNDTDADRFRAFILAHAGIELPKS